MARQIENVKIDFSLPEAVELEKAVLGVILQTKDGYDRSGVLKTECFYLPEHQEIYQSCVSLANQNKPIDTFTVAQELKNMGSSVELKYLAELTSKIASAANVEYYSGIIFEKYGLRELIQISNDTIREAYLDGSDLFELQKNAVSKMDAIAMKESREAVQMYTAFKSRIDQIADIQKSGLTITGINTGFQKINDILHGWQKSDLVIVAARPGQGKSAFALNVVTNVAKQNIPVAFFSLEMSQSQLTDRIISSETEINGEIFKRAVLNDQDWLRVSNTNFNFPLYIDDTPGLSITSFKAKARRLKKTKKIQLIVIDYLQLMDARAKGDNREQEISKISRGLKLIAKELDIPVIALAQLSRDAEKRSGLPILSDLRESGSIEQDADIVIFIHDENAADKTIQSPVIDLVIAKHRQGAVGIKKMLFKKSIQKIVDYYEHLQ